MSGEHHGPPNYYQGRHLTAHVVTRASPDVPHERRRAGGLAHAQHHNDCAFSRWRTTRHRCATDCGGFGADTSRLLEKVSWLGLLDDSLGSDVDSEVG